MLRCWPAWWCFSYLFCCLMFDVGQMLAQQNTENQPTSSFCTLVKFTSHFIQRKLLLYSNTHTHTRARAHTHTHTSVGLLLFSRKTALKKYTNTLSRLSQVNEGSFPDSKRTGKSKSPPPKPDHWRELSLHSDLICQSQLSVSPTSFQFTHTEK